jgi:phytoene dehydrogenase-like protein
MFRGGIAAVGGSLIAMAIAASPALATTDRLDYADHANPVCASSNAQVEQLYESTEAEIERLDSLHPKNRKKYRRLRERSERLYDQLPFQLLALYQAELDQLKSLAAPAGYEGTVANWLANRQQIATLALESNQIYQQQERGFRGFHKRPSRKAIKRRQKRLRNLYRRSNQIDDQLVTDSKIDLELGSRMGAAYCVTGATGQLPTDLSGSNED